MEPPFKVSLQLICSIILYHIYAGTQSAGRIFDTVFLVDPGDLYFKHNCPANAVNKSLPRYNKNIKCKTVTNGMRIMYNIKNSIN